MMSQPESALQFAITLSDPGECGNRSKTATPDCVHDAAAHLQHGLSAGRMAVADEDKAQAQRSKARNLHGHIVVCEQRRQQLPNLLLARACPWKKLKA